jgi:hypothetical protein
MRDFAAWAFRAHRAITELEVVPTGGGQVTVRFATERGDLSQWEQARHNCALWYEERIPVNVAVLFEQLHRDAQPGEQMGLLGG